MRGRSWRAVVLVVAVGAALALGTAIVAVSRGGPQVVAAASRALGREIVAVSVGLRLRGGIGVELTDVRVAGDPTSGSVEPLLTARRLALQVRVFPLLVRRVIVDKVTLEGPVLRVVQHADGRLDVVTPRPRAGGRATRLQVAGLLGEAGPLAFEIDRLRVADGTLHYTPRAGGEVTTLTRVDGEVARTNRAGGGVTSMSIDAEGGLARGRDGIEHLRARGILTLGGPAPAFRGTLEGGPGRAGNLTVRRGEAEVRTGEGYPVLRFTFIDGVVDGGGVGLAALGPLAAWLGGGAAGRLRERYPDLVGGDLQFGRATGVAEIAGARLHLRDLAVTGPSYALAGGGTIDDEGAVDVTLRLTPGSALTEELLGSRPALRAAIATPDGRVSVPLRVHGRGGRARVSADPEFVTRAAGGLARERGVEGMVGRLIEGFGAARRKR